MEDAATAEIARAQLWQWIRYPKGVLKDGRKVTIALVRQTIKEELEAIRTQVGEPDYQAGHYALAAELLDKITTSEDFAEFLTLVAYEYLP
jgi:malate synthase